VTTLKNLVQWYTRFKLFAKRYYGIWCWSQEIHEGELVRLLTFVNVDYVGHCYARSEGLAALIISDGEYPVRVAFSLLNKVLDEYLAKHPKTEWENASSNSGLDFPELDDYLKKYQDPHQADTIMKVQQELDETKIVLHKTINSVLERGEKLDSLVDKSEALSSSSRMFYKQAKKTNSCCTIS
jgi:synaptobrevin family protein YKT6